MPTFTLDDLRQIMRACAGVDESVDLDGDIDDVAFTDLGYDSLAVLELQSQIQRRYDVPMSDDAQQYMGTPADTVGYVSGLLRTAV